MIKKAQHTPKLGNLAKISVKATEWIGTTQSILVHTALFILCFALYFFGIKFDQILLILTTIVSLEAIYLALFIQMTVNRNTESLEDVEEDIEEIQEDVEGLEGDFEEVREDVEGLEGNIAKIQGNVEDIGEEFEGISEDLEKIQADEKEEKTGQAEHIHTHADSLRDIETQLIRLSEGLLTIKRDVQELKGKSVQQS